MIFVFFAKLIQKLITSIEQMRKKQLSYIILSNNRDQNKFKPIYRSKPNFQRQKSQLIQEILTYHQQNINKQNNVIQIEQRQGPYRIFSNQYNGSNEPQSMNESSQAILEQKQLNGLHEYEHKYLDQYVKQLKKIQNQDYQLIQYSTISNEKYQIIDRFIKKHNQQDINIAKMHRQVMPIHHQPYNQSKIIKQNRMSNQSTMVLSQFYRSSLSPKIKKINVFDSKIEVSQINQSKYKQNGNNSPKKYQISHSSKQQKEKKSLKIHYLQSFTKSFQKVKKEEINKSNQRDIIHSYPYNNVREQKSTSNVKKLKSSNEQMTKSPQGRIKIQEFVNQQKTAYDYDKEENIFDKIQQKKKIKPQQMKQKFKDIAQIFRIKNEEDFKKQVISQGRKINQQKIIINKKPKQQLFNGSQQLNLRKYLSKQLDKKTVNNNFEHTDQSIVDQYRFKDKNRPQNQIISKQSQRKIDRIKVDDLKKAKNKNENLSQISMKPQLSQQSSSSCSFLNQKQQINEQQIAQINNIVNKSIQAVNHNIDKIQTYRSKLITQAKQQPLPSNSKQSASKSIHQQKKISTQAQQKAFKNIFGDFRKVKSEEQSNISVNFFKGEPNGQGQIMNRPSSVHKASEQKSSDKSQMMRHLQDLRNSNLGQLLQQDLQEQMNVNKLIEQLSQQKEIIVMSQDAISFSQLADATIQHQMSPSNPIKKINIQLDPLSDSQNSKGDQVQVNLDDLQDYESDQDDDRKRISSKKYALAQSLQPVIEQNLQQTQFVSNPVKSKLSKKNSRQSQQTNKKSQQSQPKLSIKKKISSHESKAQKSSQLFKISKTISNEGKFVDTSINYDLQVKDESFVEQYSSGDVHAQEELMKSIKKDLSNLKNKIESSIIISDKLNLSKDISGLSFTSNQPKTSTKKISIQLKSNSSLSKFFNQKSFINEKKLSRQLILYKDNKSQINFDKINDQTQNQYYNEFKQDFTNLKKKMLLDAGIL